MHQDHKYPPALLDGNLKPADLHVWEQAANQYLVKMKIIDSERVPAVFGSFSNLGITNWIEGSRDTMMAEDYLFANFMRDLRENFLENSWARKIYRVEVKRAMSPNERFIDFANCIVYYNIILKATDHHSDDVKLHETLTHQMSEGLTNKIETLLTKERKHIRDIKNVNIWMREVETVDRTWKAELKTTSEMMTELLNRRNCEETRSAPRQAEPQHVYQIDQPPCPDHCDENSQYHPYCRNSGSANRNERDNDRDRPRDYDHDQGYNRPHDYDQDRGYKPHDNGYNRPQENEQRSFGNCTNENYSRKDNYNCNDSYNRNESYNRNDNYNNRQRRCPLLTQTEWDLLNEYDGCKRCRKPYVGPNHRCEGWPDAETYKPLTLQDVLNVRV